MGIHRDGPRYFGNWLVIRSLRQNDHGHFQHDALTAPLSIGFATARRRDGTHIKQATTLALENCVEDATCVAQANTQTLV